MSCAIRWIFITAGLVMLLIGCVEDNRHIRPASEAASGGSGGAGALTISWDTVMAESYDLFLGSVPGGAESGRKISNVANPFQITDLPIGSTYYLRLSANSDDRTTLQTNEIPHKIESPNDRIKVSFPTGTKDITLAWDPTDEATAYNIYWRNSPGVSRQNGIKISNVNTPHKMTGLIPGTPYYFVVTAIGTNGVESNVSEEISHTAQR